MSEATKRQVACPTCRKQTPYQDNPYRPFCSKRCRTLDLGAWADESYRVPVQESSLSSEALNLEERGQENEV